MVETRYVGPNSTALERSDLGVRTARILEIVGFTASGAGAGLFIAGLMAPKTFSFVYEEPFVVIESIVGVAGLVLILGGWMIYQWNTGAAVRR